MNNSDIASFSKYGKAFQEGLVQLIFEDRPFDFFNTTDVSPSLRWDSAMDNYEDIEDLWSKGSDDDKYFMITSLKRTIGVLTFEAREIG